MSTYEELIQEMRDKKELQRKKEIEDLQEKSINLEEFVRICVEKEFFKNYKEFYEAMKQQTSEIVLETIKSQELQQKLEEQNQTKLENLPLPEERKHYFKSMVFGVIGLFFFFFVGLGWMFYLDSTERKKESYENSYFEKPYQEIETID